MWSFLYTSYIVKGVPPTIASVNTFITSHIYLFTFIFWWQRLSSTLLVNFCCIVFTMHYYHHILDHQTSLTYNWKCVPFYKPLSTSHTFQPQATTFLLFVHIQWCHMSLSFSVWLFYVAWCLQGPSVLLQMAGVSF